MAAKHTDVKLVQRIDGKGIEDVKFAMELPERALRFTIVVRYLGREIQMNENEGVPSSNEPPKIPLPSALPLWACPPF